MKIKKIHLDDIYRCYCVSNLYFENKNHYIFASEDPNVGCYLYEEKNLQNKQILWQAPGGCMSILPIPDKPKEFLAIQEFYLKVSPSQSKLVWGKINDNGIVELADILNLPYLHRFGIIHQNNQNYLICSTIADDKENKDDWSKPGKIYVGKLGKYPTDKIKLEILEDGLFKNHGFYHNHGNNSVYCACDSGILKITLDLKTQCWQKEKIIHSCVSDIAIIDIDNDGDDEIITIEPFHGNQIKIYKYIDTHYKVIYTYNHEIDFAHALCSGTINGQNSFLAGIRRKNAELVLIQWHKNQFVSTIIDEQVGPANILLINESNQDLILSANHTKNEAAIYIVPHKAVQ